MRPSNFLNRSFYTIDLLKYSLFIKKIGINYRLWTSRSPSLLKGWLLTYIIDRKTFLVAKAIATGVFNQIQILACVTFFRWPFLWTSVHLHIVHRTVGAEIPQVTVWVGTTSLCKVNSCSPGNFTVTLPQSYSLISFNVEQKSYF